MPPGFLKYCGAIITPMEQYKSGQTARDSRRETRRRRLQVLTYVGLAVLAVATAVVVVMALRR
jgi:hypothetical protein